MVNSEPFTGSGIGRLGRGIPCKGPRKRKMPAALAVLRSAGRVWASWRTPGGQLGIRLTVLLQMVQ